MFTFGGGHALTDRLGHGGPIGIVIRRCPVGTRLFHHGLHDIPFHDVIPIIRADFRPLVAVWFRGQ